MVVPCGYADCPTQIHSSLAQTPLGWTSRIWTLSQFSSCRALWLGEKEIRKWRKEVRISRKHFRPERTGSGESCNVEDQGTSTRNWRYRIWGSANQLAAYVIHTWLKHVISREFAGTSYIYYCLLLKVLCCLTTNCLLSNLNRTSNPSFSRTPNLTVFNQDHETAASAVRNLNQFEVGGRPLRIDLADSDPFLEGKNTVRGELLDNGESRAQWQERERVELAFLSGLSSGSVEVKAFGLMVPKDRIRFAEALDHQFVSCFITIKIENSPCSQLLSSAFYDLWVLIN